MPESSSELDPETGQTVLLHLRDANGIDWHAAALLSPLRSATSSDMRPIEPGEEINLISIKLVIR